MCLPFVAESAFSGFGYSLLLGSPGEDTTMTDVAWPYVPVKYSVKDIMFECAHKWRVIRKQLFFVTI